MTKIGGPPIVALELTRGLLVELKDFLSLPAIDLQINGPIYEVKHVMLTKSVVHSPSRPSSLMEL
jgi:hypothetical protein